MDVIILASEPVAEVLYRPTGAHSFVAGVGGVVSITSTEMATPRSARPLSTDNVCGGFRCPFYKQGREGLLIRNDTFGGYQAMHHLDGMMQVFKSVDRACRMAFASASVGQPRPTMKQTRPVVEGPMLRETTPTKKLKARPKQSP